MNKQRFRDVKKGKVAPKKKMVSPKRPHAPLRSKIKALLTDLFLLLMPLLYFVIYVIMGGREEASHHKLLSWGYALVPYVIILSLFMIKDRGRSPGMRSQSLQVVNSLNFTRASVFSIIFRNVSFLLTLAIPFIWILPFFRKDRKSLHDLLSATTVVKQDDAAD